MTLNTGESANLMKRTLNLRSMSEQRNGLTNGMYVKYSTATVRSAEREYWANGNILRRRQRQTEQPTGTLDEGDESTLTYKLILGPRVPE
jgi:hypothetical protein